MLAMWHENIVGQHERWTHASPTLNVRGRWIGLAVAISVLLLFGIGVSVYAYQGVHLQQPLTNPQSPMAVFSPTMAFASSPSTDVLTTTYYLPLIGRTTAQPVTTVAPEATWSAAWWQWAESLNSAPILAEGDVDCTLGQSGDLWFLAGTTGDRPTIRTCTLPAGKILMVPLHTVAWGNEGTENLTVAEKRATLDGVYSATEPGLFNSKICVLESTVNGQAMSNARLFSPPFLHKGDPEGVADGFWFAFSLSPGTHVVRFRGTLCDFATDTPINDVLVTYFLQVEASAAVTANRP
ncbi:MAG: hypothetical protein R2867_10335 [Caldilineaceae bacterium]|nr:hypothetical protein [Caldilineaceae bacterium]